MRWRPAACRSNRCCGSAARPRPRGSGPASRPCAAPTWPRCWPGCRRPGWANCGGCNWRRRSTRRCCSCSGPAAAAAQTSPARLRLQLVGCEDDRAQIDIHILKRRGPPLAAPIQLPARSERMAALLAASQLRRKLRRQEEGARAAAAARERDGRPPRSPPQEATCTGSHCSGSLSRPRPPGRPRPALRRSPGLVGPAVHAARRPARRGAAARGLGLRAPVGRAPGPACARSPASIRRRCRLCLAQGATSLVALARLRMRARGQQPPADLPGELPLDTLSAAREHLDVLAHLGCRSWGEVAALPRGGLTRRFGKELRAGARRGLRPPAREPPLADPARRLRAEAGTARAGRGRARADVVGQPAARRPADLAAGPAARRGGARAAMDARPAALQRRRPAAAPADHGAHGRADPGHGPSAPPDGRAAGAHHPGRAGQLAAPAHARDHALGRRQHQLPARGQPQGRQAARAGRAAQRPARRRRRC